MLNLTQEEIMKNWIPTEDGKPMVSVRCIAYNHEKYIRRMIESVLVQKTNFPFQIVIHDDASTDKTAEIIQEYADKYPQIIIPILEEENQYSKLGCSMERVMDPHTTGRYCCELEGDDYWIDNNKLQEQYQFLLTHPDVSLAASRRKKVDEFERVIPYKHFKNDIVYSSNEILHMNEMIHASTWMYINYFQNETLMQKYNNIIKAGAAGDWSQMIFLADLGNVFVSKKCYSARRVILRSNADNYNSRMKYKTNKFDVLKKVFLSEYNTSKLKFDRITYKFNAIKYMSEFRFNYLFASKKDKKYASTIFKESYVPITSVSQRFFSWFYVFNYIFSIIKVKMYNYKSKLETQSELGKKI